jgi:hypothetical protein
MRIELGGVAQLQGDPPNARPALLARDQLERVALEAALLVNRQRRREVLAVTGQTADGRRASSELPRAGRSQKLHGNSELQRNVKWLAGATRSSAFQYF